MCLLILNACMIERSVPYCFLREDQLDRCGNSNNNNRSILTPCPHSEPQMAARILDLSVIAHYRFRFKSVSPDSRKESAKDASPRQTLGLRSIVDAMGSKKGCRTGGYKAMD